MNRSPGFRDLFSRDPADYSKFRPRYPPELFQWLATLTASRQLAWDCATGNGQAATLLVPHFRRVVASDASVAQVKVGDRISGLSYLACLAEQAAIVSRSCDLITVAQALHWLDRDRFFAEVDRVIASSGVLAIIGYARLYADPAVEAAIWKFQDQTVGPYWTPERGLVDRGYRDIPIPIEEVKAPAFSIEADLTMRELLGYVGTWSAVARYRKQRGEDPLRLLETELRGGWEDPASRRRIRWPLFVRAGKWKPGAM